MVMPVRDPWFAALRERAAKEPLSVDISDYSDDFCAGFLAGQVNGLDAVDANITEFERVIALCAADTTAPDLAQDVEFLKAALVQILDLAKDEPGGLNYASRASRIARDAQTGAEWLAFVNDSGYFDSRKAHSQSESG